MTEFAAAAEAIGGRHVAPKMRATFYIIYVSTLALLSVGGAELVLRARGIRPWRADGVTVPSIHVEPGGKFFQTHPELGYSHIPGRFKVTLGLTDPSAASPGHPDHLQFTVTHLPNTLRITHPVDRATDESGKPDLGSSAARSRTAGASTTTRRTPGYFSSGCPSITLSTSASADTGPSIRCSSFARR